MRLLTVHHASFRRPLISSTLWNFLNPEYGFGQTYSFVMCVALWEWRESGSIGSTLTPSSVAVRWQTLCRKSSGSYERRQCHKVTIPDCATCIKFGVRNRVNVFCSFHTLLNCNRYDFRVIMPNFQCKTLCNRIQEAYSKPIFPASCKLVSNIFLIHFIHFAVSAVQILSWLIQVLNLVLDDVTYSVNSCSWKKIITSL